MPKLNFDITSIWRKTIAFIFSWDAVVFCFFVALSAGIWFLQARAKAPSQPQRTDAETRQEVVYTEKQFVLPIAMRGVPSGTDILLFPDEITVTARVAIEQYDQLKINDFQAICTYKSGKEQLPVEVSCSFPDVTILHTRPTEVECKYFINANE